MLSENGFSVIRANDGREALQLVKQNDPDLIVLDIVLPHLNGLKVCEILKSNEDFSHYHHIPVILVTSLEQIEDRVKGVEAGADDFINKPIDGRLLLARINSLLMKKLSFEKIKEGYVEAKKEAVIDELTGLFNYRFLKNQINKIITGAKNKLQPISILMIDIDDFKKYNDTLGHPEGNNLLRRVARELKLSIRFEDYVIRYGGEEFIVILTNTALDGASKVAERMLKRIKTIKHNPTVSIGIACYPEIAEDGEKLIKMADEALYRAKSEGKNCFRIADKAVN